MDTPSRRSGIPVPTAKTSSLKKIFSKSSDDLLADDFHNHSGDLDAFTLLEENIALKERTENLATKSNASKYRFESPNIMLLLSVCSILACKDEEKLICSISFLLYVKFRFLHLHHSLLHSNTEECSTRTRKCTFG